MGATRTMNSQRYICIALAAVFVAAYASDIPPAIEHEVDLQATWAEAHAEVLVQQKAGKDDSACQEVANDAKDEVTDSCKAAQKMVNDLPRGPHCCKKGQALVDQEQRDLDDAQKVVKDCYKKLDQLNNVRVTFKNVKYKELRDGQCHHSFFSGKSYRTARDNVKNQKTKCIEKEQAVKVARNALASAKRERYKRRDSCRTRTKTDMRNMVNRANSLCRSSKNRKAWARAHHMLCVLKKSTLKNCRVPNLPSVHAAKLNLNKCLSYKAGREFTVQSRCDHAVQQQLQYLDRQHLQCGKADSALTRFHFHGCGGANMRYTGRCHTSTNGYARTWTKYTPCNHAQYTDLQFLDRHHVNCGHGNVLTGFYFARNGCGGRNMRYRYTCATPRAQMGGTQTKYTGCNIAGQHRLQYLDRHAPDCGHGRPMQGFYFQRCHHNRFRYKYECTLPGKGQGKYAHGI